MRRSPGSRPSSSRWSASGSPTAAARTTGRCAWNLLLAWIPFVVALHVYDGYRRQASRLSLWAGGLLWLVFFPNAPYIVTDFKHLRTWTGAPIWFDVVLVSAAAWCGLLLGFMSLYLLQAVVRRALGTVNAWVFVFAVLALSSFGIYLGRFLRWNSWDVFTRPGVLARGRLAPNRRPARVSKDDRRDRPLHRVPRSDVSRLLLAGRGKRPEAGRALKTRCSWSRQLSVLPSEGP